MPSSCKPDDGANYAGRGWTYYQMGDYEAALQDYARAIELQPDRAFFYSERATIHRELGHDLKAALQDYNRAIELDPRTGITATSENICTIRRIIRSSK